MEARAMPVAGEAIALPPGDRTKLLNEYNRLSTRRTPCAALTYHPRRNRHGNIQMSKQLLEKMELVAQRDGKFFQVHTYLSAQAVLELKREHGHGQEIDLSEMSKELLEKMQLVAQRHGKSFQVYTYLFVQALQELKQERGQKIDRFNLRLAKGLKKWALDEN